MAILINTKVQLCFPRDTIGIDMIYVIFSASTAKKYTKASLHYHQKNEDEIYARFIFGA